MASIISSFNEAFSDDFAWLKLIFYAIPSFYLVTLTNHGDISPYVFGVAIFCSFLELGLLTDGIHNVRMSKSNVLTLNPLKWIWAGILALIVLIPNVLIFGGIAFGIIMFLTKLIYQPVALIIVSIVVYAIFYSIVATSYLSFAKHLNLIQAFRYIVVLKSSADILVGLFFMVIQMAILNVIFIAPGYYVAFLLKIPYTHSALIFYCCVVSVLNISILANYLSQLASEQIEESNETYDENMNMSDVIADISERMS